MQDNVSIVNAALRVMEAISKDTQPTAEDLEKLRQFAPDQADLPPYKLACQVIQGLVQDALIQPGSQARPFPKLLQS